MGSAKAFCVLLMALLPMEQALALIAAASIGMAFAIG
jgi:hypothetical protein